MQPACPHGDVCPGCPLLGLPYPAQLTHKAGALARALDPYPSLAGAAVAPVRAANPPLAYRRRAKWMVDDAGAMGLYDARFQVVDIPDCQVVDPAVRELSGALRRLLRPARHPGLVGLRAVDLRALRGDAPGLFVTLVFTRGALPARGALEAVARALAAELPLRSLFVNEVAPDAPQVLGPRTEAIWGPEEADDRFAGVPLRAAPGAFIQAHEGQSRAVAERLVSWLEGLGEAPRVLDLFAGTGMWSVPLARAGARVLAVESFAPAATRIEATARREGLALEARAVPAEEATRALRAEGARFALVVVNPPRRGLSPALREAIAALRPARVAYLSCDPETLARDLDALSRLGLGAAALEPLDMIPLSDHLETLARLEPASAPALAPLARCEWGLAYDKAGHEEAHALGARVGAPGGPRFAPAREQSGVTLFAEASASLEGAEATLLLAVQGVTHKKGRLRGRHGDARYRRLAVAAGHSLLELSCPLEAVAELAPLLRRIGHPPLGSRHAAPRARRHTEARLGLDRAFFHVAQVRAGALVAEAPLAPDLRAAAARLGLDPAAIPRGNAPDGQGV